jgi:Ca2+-binding EF-hand superfamily protein
VYFKETTYIDKEDFTKVFEHAINKARHEAIKDEARDDFTRMTRRNTHNENNYDLGEVRRILGYCVQSGTIDHLREAITNRARGGVIDHYALKDSLCNVGQVPDTDALRFCNFFDKDQSKKIHIDLVLQHM